MAKRKPHPCEVPEGFECIGGKLYNDEKRIPRPLCPCTCHRKKGDVI